MSTQCEGKTKSGARCTKKTRNASKRCHFHPEDLVEHWQVIVLDKKKAKKSDRKKSGKKELSEQSSDNTNKSEKTDCCVCMEEMPDSDKLDCGHHVCRGCIGKLRNDKCPMCRRNISAKHITSQMKLKMRQNFEEDRTARILGAALAPVFIHQ
jgi:hypothetical protein